MQRAQTTQHRNALKLGRIFRRDLPLCIMVTPGIVLIFIFSYIPIYGILISFMSDYNPRIAFFQNKWVGFENFIMFFKSPYFFRIMGNTFKLGILNLVFSFPAPILLALILNEIRFNKFKRLAQTISYMPYFISTVIVVGLLSELFSYRGNINDILEMIFGTRYDFMVLPEWFRFLYVSSAIWQSIGFSSIIYLAAIAGIDPSLYEAAIIDGAGRWKSIWNITLPCIAPVVVILLIMSIPSIVGSDLGKILLMYSPQTYRTSDVVSTYVFREGVQGARFSYTTAVGLFMNVIGFVFLVTANKICKLVGETSLW